MSSPPKQLWFHYLPGPKVPVPDGPKGCNDPHLWEQPYFSEKEAIEALDAASLADGWKVIGPYILSSI